MWCAEGAATKRQWPGCLPTGTGKREGRGCCAHAVCCVCPLVLTALPICGGCRSCVAGGAHVLAPAAVRWWRCLRRAPPFSLGAVALWAGRAVLPTALRAGAAAVLLLVLLRRCYWHRRLTSPRYQSRGYGGATPWSSSAAAGKPWLVATVAPPPRSLCGSLQPALPRYQGAIGVMLDPGALLVVGGPGLGARPPMGGLPSCLAAPHPPWHCGCSWGGRALVLSPLLRRSVHCLAAPTVVGGVVHGPCCPVLCLTMVVSSQ